MLRACGSPCWPARINLVSLILLQGTTWVAIIFSVRPKSRVGELRSWSATRPFRTTRQKEPNKRREVCRLEFVRSLLCTPNFDLARTSLKQRVRPILPLACAVGCTKLDSRRLVRTEDQLIDLADLARKMDPRVGVEPTTCRLRFRNLNVICFKRFPKSIVHRNRRI